MTDANVTPPPPVKTQPYKAVAGFVIAFLAQLLVEVQGTPGGDDLSNITLTEWIIAVIASLVVAGTVWAVPNPAVGPRSASRRRAVGAVDTRLIAILALVIAVVVVLILVL
jgi:hypothetical protein